MCWYTDRTHASIHIGSIPILPKKERKMGTVIKSIIIIIGVLISIAYITLGERKIMGLMQRRIGPNKIGKIQPIADGLKLISKEIIIPKKSRRVEILIGPIIILALCLILWIPVPILRPENIIMENKYGIIYILAVSSLNVYLYIYSGWSTLSKYAYLGSLRSIAQLISYEVSIGIILMNVMILNNSLNISELIKNQIYIPFIVPLLPIFIIFLFSILAETNRPPFDLAESESELIAGYIIEYGGFAFAAIYLAEYGFIFFFSYLTSLLFTSSTIILTTLIIIVFYIWIRSTLPRIRYDQLIKLGWTSILPISLSYLILSTSILYYLLP